MAAFFSILSEEELTDVKRGLAAMQKLVNK
jgi:hypothetical protein